jgi:SAM-dependent methyltransferase
VAGDLSLGMIRRQQTQDNAARIALTNLDAQALPFPNGLFDVVLANHMLFHVPDIDVALSEIGRVLKPDGVLLATTNSVNNMPEITTLYRRAVMLLTNFKYKGQISTTNAERFSLENGPGILSHHFAAVARFDLPSALVFPEPIPIIEYLDSMRELRETSLPEGISWEEFMAVMRQQVVRLVAFHGPMRVRKLSGVLVATNAGGFAAEYARLGKGS